MDGWIKLHRKLLDWQWYDDTNIVRVFLHLLLKANFDIKGWHDISIERGQLVTSIKNLAAETHLSEMQIRRALTQLQKTKEITIETTNKYTMITICNYAKYQCIDSGEQQTNNNQTTNEQQSNNNQTTTTKEINNKRIKELKNNSKVIFTPPTIEEVKEYCKERKNNVDAERFIDFYTMKGWFVGKNKMKDWKAAVRTWEGKPTTNALQTKKEKENLDVNRFWNFKN